MRLQIIAHLRYFAIEIEVFIVFGLRSAIVIFKSVSYLIKAGVGIHKSLQAFVIRMRFFMLHHIKMVFFGFREYFATVLGLNYIHYLKVNRARHADYLMREMLPVI